MGIYNCTDTGRRSCPTLRTENAHTHNHDHWIDIDNINARIRPTRMAVYVCGPFLHGHYARIFLSVHLHAARQMGASKRTRFFGIAAICWRKVWYGCYAGGWWPNRWFAVLGLARDILLFRRVRSGVVFDLVFGRCKYAGRLSEHIHRGEKVSGQYTKWWRTKKVSRTVVSNTDIDTVLEFICCTFHRQLGILFVVERNPIVSERCLWHRHKISLVDERDAHMNSSGINFNRFFFLFYRMAICPLYHIY